jgi:hypothetical protein
VLPVPIRRNPPSSPVIVTQILQFLVQNYGIMLSVQISVEDLIVDGSDLDILQV